MLKKLTAKLIQRGYKKETIEKQINQVKFETRKTELQRKFKATKKCLTFVTKYCDDIPEIKQIITNNWDMIHRSKQLQMIFTQRPVIGLKRNPNLRNKLVRAKLKRQLNDYEPETGTHKYPTHPKTKQQLHPNYPWNLFDHQQKIKKCGLRNCKTCPKLSTKNFIQSYTNKMKFPVINKGETLSCNSRSIIYCIECTKCRKQYVGQTIRRLKDRAEEHLNPTRNLTTALKKHFLKTKNHSCSNMKFQLLQIVPQQLDREETIRQLTAAETKWILNLQTLRPNGLNSILIDPHYRKR